MKILFWFIFCTALYIATQYTVFNTVGVGRLVWQFIQWGDAFFGGAIVMYEILDAQGRVRD